MDVMNIFDAEIYVSTISRLKDLNEIVKETKTFDDSLRNNILQEIESITRGKDQS
jgi:hypothetical protein